MLGNKQHQYRGYRRPPFDSAEVMVGHRSGVQNRIAQVNAKIFLYHEPITL